MASMAVRLTIRAREGENRKKKPTRLTRNDEWVVGGWMMGWIRLGKYATWMTVHQKGDDASV